MYFLGADECVVALGSVVTGDVHTHLDRLRVLDHGLALIVVRGDEHMAPWVRRDLVLGWRTLGGSGSHDCDDVIVDDTTGSA